MTASERIKAIAEEHAELERLVKALPSGIGIRDMDRGWKSCDGCGAVWWGVETHVDQCPFAAFEAYRKRMG